MTMPRRRPGYALIELLVVITVVAVMLTLCAGMLHLLMKLDRSGRTASEEAADLGRLARDFRADAHASSKLEPLQSGEGRMVLPLEGGRTVEYLARPLDILRTVRDGEKVRRFESYRRPKRATVTFWMDGVGPGSFAVLMIDRPQDGREDSLYSHYWIEAELGKDLRLNPRAE